MVQVNDARAGTGMSSARLDGPAARLRAALSGELAPLPVPRPHPDRLVPVVTLDAVVHEFPGVDHLVAAVAHGLRRLAPGGSLVVTEVPSLPLLAVAHTAAALARAAEGDLTGAPSSRTTELLAERIRGGIAAEPDLAVDPRLFDALPAVLPGIAAVRVTPRCGPDTPRNRFRYDVTLVATTERVPTGTVPVGTGIVGTGAAGETPDWPDWDAAGLTRAEIEAEFREREAEVLTARDVPNARVERFAQALHRITTDPGTSLRDLLALVAAPGPDEVDPQQLRDLARAYGYHVELDFSRHEGDGRFDLLAWRDDVPAPALRRRPDDVPGLTELPDRAGRGDEEDRPGRVGSGHPHGLGDLANVPHRPVTGA